MEQEKKNEPDNTAVRVALWRALHVQVDAAPHIIEDEVGLKLIAPEEGWKDRRDMHPDGLKHIRASIVGRARYIEDIATEQAAKGISQYVILGAGLDTFAQRRPEVASKMQVYEIDQPNTQVWKQRRLIDTGYDIPTWLHFVPVNFEAGMQWWEQIKLAGFDANKPAVVACTGVSLYLTTEAIMDILRRVSGFASGSVLAMTFYLPIDLMDAADRPMQERAQKGAREAGTPFISFFAPEEVLELAHEAGFRAAKIVSAEDLSKLYFSGRADNFFPTKGEMFLVAEV